MARWARHALGIFGVLSTAGCTGSSCCSGPAMVDPLPDGFDPSSRVENGAAVRFTQSGFQFIQENIGAISSSLLASSGLVESGIVKVPIPTSPLQGTGYDLVICPDGPDPATGACIAEIQLDAPDRTFTTADPNLVMVAGTIPLRIKNLPISGTILGVPVGVDTAVSGGGNTDCDPAAMTFKNVDLDATASVAIERDHAFRADYSKLTVEQLSVDPQQLTDGLHACGTGLDDATVNTLKGALGPVVLDSFLGGMRTAINQQFCLKANSTATPACPPESSEKDGLCWYADQTCVSSLLGFDGRARLDALLSSFSPGSRGGLEFVLAMGGASPRSDDPAMASGDLNPVAGGATMGMFGGALPSPSAPCVKPVALDIPTAIPIPSELLANAPTGWTGQDPHVGFALSERFANYFLGNAYNAGALCLGFSTDQVAQLSTGLFGLLVPSIKLLSYKKQNAPILLQLRPQKPPTLTVGGGTDLATDPLLRVAIDQVLVDFYVWSTDRFIRAFTLQGDLNVPVNLDVSPEGILPVLDNVTVGNPIVTNSALMKESPQKIAAGLADAISGLAGQFLGGLQPFDVSGLLERLGLAVELESQSVRRLTEGTDSYVGIFARLGLPSAAASLRSDTSASLADRFTPQEGFRLATHSAANRPRLTIRAASPQQQPGTAVEFSYRLDAGFWHPWTRATELIVDDPYLMMQGRHEVAVRSRVTGVPSSVDPTPAIVGFTVDVDPPEVLLTAAGHGATRVQAWDNVDAPASLSLRHRFDDGVWTEWTALTPTNQVAAPDGARSVAVEVRDEQGNSSQAVRYLEGPKSRSRVLGGALLLSAPEDSPPPPDISPFSYVGLGALALSFVLLQRSRRSRRPTQRRAWAAATGFVGLAFAGSWSGCNCLDDIDVPATEEPTSQDGGIPGGCGTPGVDPCIVLNPGLVGAYTSSAVAADGTIWVSGYNEADWEGETPYGDLVVGQLNPGTGSVTWQSVDGVPSDPAPDPAFYDLTSWRGGQDVAGDDVGLWSSLALDASGNPRVAYYDATNAALKFAAFDGRAWSTSTVYQKPGQDSGRYAKLILLDGKPVIAFQVIEPASGGFARSRLVLARANSGAPDSGDWAFEDVVVDDQTPCRANLCPEDTVCVQATTECTGEGTGCDPKCASGQACIDSACVPIFDGTKLDAWPAAIGGYISLADLGSDNPGIVYYDRVRGNLMQAVHSGGTWLTRVLDGQDASTPPVDTGNVGVGASLFVDAAGTWHVAYVDANQRVLRYVAVSGGVSPGPVQIVDDGLGLGTTPFEDAWHAVGEDANIIVTSGGEVRIAYQDATAGTLRYAVGTPTSSGVHTWVIKSPDQPGFAGFFPQQLTVGGETRIANWWRTGGAKIEGGVRLVAP